MSLRNQLLKEMIRRSSKRQERLLRDAFKKWPGEGFAGLKRHIKTVDRVLQVNRTMEAGIDSPPSPTSHIYMLTCMVASDTPFNGIVNSTGTTLRIVARPVLTTSEKLSSSELDLRVCGYGRRSDCVMQFLDS